MHVKKEGRELELAPGSQDKNKAANGSPVVPPPAHAHGGRPFKNQGSFDRPSPLAAPPFWQLEAALLLRTTTPPHEN